MRLYFFFISTVLSLSCEAQTVDNSITKTVSAGPEYKKPSIYLQMWGANYRREWITPLQFPITFLDTLAGGIKKIKEGGSHQSHSLHLTTSDDKSYALRSVDKSMIKLIPEEFQKTWLADIVNDKISMMHPYGALAVPQMAGAIHIPYTMPMYTWLPKQVLLDSFNNTYGDKLYIFEQRPGGDWSHSANMGSFPKFTSSEELMDKLSDKHKTQIDQPAFAKARLFDMLIGDWDRHWGQWKWGLKDSSDENLFEPVPTDRDQVFSTYNGILLKAVIAASGMKFLQPFKATIKDVNALNSARNMLDRYFTNQLYLNQWLSQAQAIQQALTDNVIESSVKQMPPEIFAISGKDIITKLKSRRDHLLEYATKYYKFLAKEVEITGSKQDEYFEVKRQNKHETLVNVFAVSKKGNKEPEPYYSRTFLENETKEIRIYGLSGNDVYSVSGVGNGIIIRIIGGDQKDSIIDKGTARIHVYDNRNNVFLKGKKTRLHISDNTDHTFKFDTFLADKRGLKPEIFYNNPDRLYVGIGYSFIHHAWRKLPYAFKQDVSIHYSISQKAFSFLYGGIFTKAVGSWDLKLNADYDQIRWTNFFGVGNRTVLTGSSVNYNRIRSEEVHGNIGLAKRFKNSTIGISALFEGIKIINDTGRLHTKIYSQNDQIFRNTNYAGGQAEYQAVFFNHPVVPTKGFSFLLNAKYAQNISEPVAYQLFGGKMESYIPVIGKLSLFTKAACETVTGDPLVYQLPTIGGSSDLRGYIKERFRGNTVFTNSNELRFVTKIRTYLMNGSIGLLVLYDEGRVWQRNEMDNTWHTDYGAGIMFAPFNKFLITATYGISPESNLIQLNVTKGF